MLILNCRFTTSTNFHNVLHGLWVGYGICNASLEDKLLQNLKAIREEVLYAIFLDLHKTYDALDRDI